MHDSGGFYHDEICDEFDGFNDARTQAQSLLPDIAREELPDREPDIVACDVRDETVRMVYRGHPTYEEARNPV